MGYWEAALSFAKYCGKDMEEIKELMALISYETPCFGRGIFHKEYIGGIYVETKDGKTYGGTIEEGTLPEKYILRFGELAQ